MIEIICGLIPIVIAFVIVLKWIFSKEENQKQSKDNQQEEPMPFWGRCILSIFIGFAFGILSIFISIILLFFKTEMPKVFYVYSAIVGFIVGLVITHTPQTK